MKRFFAFLWAALLCLAAVAQTDSQLPQVFSPNAAELGKYGKIPVSYFNGLPNISIPLTELKENMRTNPDRYAVWFFTALGIAESAR